MHNVQNDVIETIRTKAHELPVWISGEVNKFDQDDLLVSEEESFIRIQIILLVISTFEIIVATAFVLICMNLSRSISPKEWLDIATESKYIYKSSSSSQ